MTTPPQDHLALLVQRCPCLETCIPSIRQAYELMLATYQANGKLLLCGNGGSGSDAEHIAGELLKGFCKKRPLPPADQTRIGDIAPHLQGALACIPLTGFVALRTAWLNDCEPDYLYAQLVYGLGRPADTLWGISTSGNAKNVAHALITAKRLGLSTLGLTGQHGGRMNDLCDVTIRVPESQTYRIQELHLPIYHCLSLMLEDAFFPS